MNAQMFLVVITFLTAAALALGANVPNAPNNQPQPSQLLIASGPPNPGPYAGPQQVPGNPAEPGKDAGGDSDDLTAAGFFWGFPSYRYRGGYRSPYYGYGGGYYGNYGGGYYGNYGYPSYYGW